MPNSKQNKNIRGIIFRSAFDLLEEQKQEQQQKNISTTIVATTAVAFKNSKMRKRQARNEQSQKLAEGPNSK